MKGPLATHPVLVSVCAAREATAGILKAEGVATVTG